jgi:hypothetical protein
MQHYLYYLKYLAVPFSSEVLIHYRSAIVLILVLIIFSFAIDFFLSHSIFGVKYRYFLAPGVIIHELAHGFACFFTGAKVSEMSLFEKDGGHVKHTRPRIPILGPVLISLAPLIAGIVIIFFVSKFLSMGEISMFKNGLNAQAIMSANQTIIHNLVGLSVKNWILLYIVVSTAVTMIPSRKDFVNAFFPLLILIVAFLIISKYTHILLPLASFNFLLVSALNLLILMLILSIIIFAISNTFKSSP